MLCSIYSKLVGSQNPQNSYKIVISTIMYLNAGTKLREKVAALNVVHYIPSQLYLLFPLKD